MVQLYSINWEVYLFHSYGYYEMFERHFQGINKKKHIFCENFFLGGGLLPPVRNQFFFNLKRLSIIKP